MHQSPRSRTIASIRLRPLSGIQVTAAIAARASSRKPSTEANHCSVARKIVGFLVRQS